VTTITIGDTKNINVTVTRCGVEINFDNIKESTTRLELERADAELLLVRLQDALNKV
jgi:phosphotransferase system IIB component